MSNTCKISVIIPVYNVEKYLGECLDSVINQTLRDIEIILIDDGSTDSSLEICKKYAQKDERIVVLAQKNLGSGAARNNGIGKANGEFVIFLDSDDYYPAQDILESLYQNAVEHNVNICGGAFSVLNEQSVISDFGQEFAGYAFEHDGLTDYRDYQFDYGYHRFIYGLEFLKKNNIKFPEFRRFQDPPFFVNAMYKAKKFYALTKITYRLREGHKTINWNSSQQKGLLDGILYNLNFAKTHGLTKLYRYTLMRLCQHSFVLEEFGTITSVLKYIQIFLILDRDKVNEFYPELKSCLRKLLSKAVQSVFSIKNFGNHKVLTVLGVKMKFRRNHRKCLKSLSYVEIHLTEHCNLNCRGCSHFSPLADKEYTDIHIFEKDIKRLSFLTNKHIGRIRLMGGEPLLHPQCTDFFFITRKYFPDSEVILVTNGILLTAQNNEFWKACRENNIIIENTKYPINLNYAEIEQKAAAENVVFQYAGNTNEVVKTLHFDPLDFGGNQNAKENFLNCFHSANCIFLSDGKLSTCPIIPNIKHFNRFFGKNIPVSSRDQIDIHKVKNLKKILKFLSSPAPFCKYCNIKKRVDGLPWAHSKKDIKEWSI